MTAATDTSVSTSSDLSVDSDEIQSIDVIISSMRPWIRAVATRRMGQFHSDLDDVIQEGLIAAWKALDTYDGSSPLDWYLKMRSERRMMSVLKNHSWFGQETERQSHTTVKGAASRSRISEFISEYSKEHGSRPSYEIIAQNVGLSIGTISHHMKRGLDIDSRSEQESMSLDSLTENPTWAYVLEDPQQQDLLDGVLNAYHHGHIHEAIQNLTDKQREFVQLHFWGEMSFSEMSKKFGYSPQGIWKGAKRNLEQSLGDLDA